MRNKYKILNAILSCSISQDCIDRHINIWKKNGYDLVFYSSKDSYPRNTYGHTLYKRGISGHNGIESINRHILFLKHMVSLDYDWYLINDYDSICLTDPAELINEPAIFGNVFYQSLENSEWQSPIFIHPPYFIHKEIIKQILSLNLEKSKEYSLFDRWLGLSCVKLKIPPINFLEMEVGYAQNTIEEKHLQEITEDKKFIHGIKDEKTLEFILSQQNNKKNNQKILYTGGTYDIFHFGHFNFLKQCKAISEKVIVSLNTDEFITQFKGSPPIMSYEEREQSLIHCPYVDQVIPNSSGSDSKPTILKVKPDIIAIGDDWAHKDYCSQMDFTLKWLENQNIVLVYIPYTKEISTTEIKKRIKDRG